MKLIILKRKWVYKIRKINNYFIEFKIYNPYLHLYFKLLKNKINEVTFSPINFKVLNGGKLYFYTKKGLKKEVFKLMSQYIVKKLLIFQIYMKLILTIY